jgi:hypothetical protein
LPSASVKGCAARSRKRAWCRPAQPGTSCVMKPAIAEFHILTRSRAVCRRRGGSLDASRASMLSARASPHVVHRTAVPGRSSKKPAERCGEDEAGRYCSHQRHYDPIAYPGCRIAFLKFLANAATAGHPVQNKWHRQSCRCQCDDGIGVGEAEHETVTENIKKQRARRNPAGDDCYPNGAPSLSRNSTIIGKKTGRRLGHGNGTR